MYYAKLVRIPKPNLVVMELTGREPKELQLRQSSTPRLQGMAAAIRADDSMWQLQNVDLG